MTVIYCCLNLTHIHMCADMSEKTRAYQQGQAAALRGLR